MRKRRGNDFDNKGRDISPQPTSCFFFSPPLWLLKSPVATYRAA